MMMYINFLIYNNIHEFTSYPKHPTTNQKVHLNSLRLLDQLQELEDNKADLTQEEYEEMKESTRADLETFQTFLSNCQKGDQILDS